MTLRTEGSTSPILSALDVSTAQPAGQVSSLERVVPLWIDLNRGDEPRPTLQVRDEVMTAANANWCSGRWQLHIYNFAAEAMTMRKTLAKIESARFMEAGARASGEGLLLVRVEAQGDFSCAVVDHRGKEAQPAMGSWAVSHDMAEKAAAYIPDRQESRALALSRMVRREFENIDERGAAQDLVAQDLATRVYAGSIALQEVVDEANTILEPLGRELEIDDRAVKSAIERHVNQLMFPKDRMIRQIAQELILDMPESDDAY